MNIPRAIKGQIIDKLIHSEKAVVLYGPRQAGKTTLAQEIVTEMGLKTLSVDGGVASVQKILSSLEIKSLGQFVSGYDLLFVDEAQKIPSIGENLKLLIDHVPNLKILATGSSSFDLAKQVSEPLTGRKWVFTLYPIAQVELIKLHNQFEIAEMLPELLIWGSYPNIFSLESLDDKRNFLAQLTSDYLYRDILELTNIKNSQKIRDLLKLIAFQIGSQVSLTELGTSLGMSKDTVEKYIDLLEKSFVLFRLKGFSRNLRKEVTKMDKIYFYDLGVRNALIDNYNLLEDRNDQGQLWENFLVIERLKRNSYLPVATSPYFWRLYSGAEIDYLEEDSGQLRGYEFKWREKKTRPPKTWLETYHNATYREVSSTNYLDFVL